MTITQTAKRLEVTAHTLRYYEKLGLLREVEQRGGKRDYSEEDITWLKFILRLKKTNMPLKNIKIYSDLRYQGDSTITTRKEMLITQRQSIQTEIDLLQSHLIFLDKKIQIYKEMENGRNKV